MARLNATLGTLLTLALLGTACGVISPSSPPTPQADPVADPHPASAVPPQYSVSLDPVRAGDTRVSGEGPAGLPLRVVDMSLAGEPLGEGVVAQDGTFLILLGSPVAGGNRVGILLGELTGSKYSQSDFAVRDVPLIGAVVASQFVEP